MKMAIFDCFSGASGNMITGSLLNVTLSQDDLLDVVNSMGLNIELRLKEVKRNGIKANLVEVEERGKSRRYSEVVKLIAGADIEEVVKKESLQIFERIAKAEGKIHGTDYRNAIFHEVGSDDAIFDVVCAVTGITRLKNKGYRIFTTPVYAGRGFAETHHGILPVPAPATLEIVKNSKLRVLMDGEGELLTPTGAAILSHFSEGVPNLPFRVENINYGAGTRELEKPNLLRLILAEGSKADSVVIVETNIDDMSGEDIANAMEILSKICHDVSLIPATGKKSRPAWILKAIADHSRAEEVAETIMKETTSIGVRIIPVHHRIKASRHIKKIEVEVGGKKYIVRVKVSDYRTKPEFEDIKQISRETGIPVIKVRKIIEEKINEA
ncbi:nickel pincer cofactor biosynthesis protein LarC [Geoglobus acetivorans]|uniref:Putative nickel insertion protein n=1 Tax=Geoglobus acetivorans TaxID=565033 RepID=A0A0A7GDS8_GEOAI|nr:hypothetical protein GACE_0061 [Geoglobus acetivorans]